MAPRPKFNFKYLLIVIILLVLVYHSMGLNIEIMVSTVVWIDLIIAITAIIKGSKSNNYGTVIGGAICGLIALSASPTAKEPSIGTLLTLIVAGTIGVGSFLIDSASDVF